MLHVCTLSGEEVLAIEAELNDVRHLKRLLQERLQVPRFRQKLWYENTPLEDDMPLKCVGDGTVQLVILPFIEASQEELQHFIGVCARGELVAVEEMLQKPLDPDLQLETGQHALLAACRGRHKDVLSVLLEAGATKLNDLDYSPLVAAFEEGFLEGVQLLLEAGARPELLREALLYGDPKRIPTSYRFLARLEVSGCSQCPSLTFITFMLLLWFSPMLLMMLLLRVHPKLPPAAKAMLVLASGGLFFAASCLLLPAARHLRKRFLDPKIRNAASMFQSCPQLTSAHPERLL